MRRRIKSYHRLFSGTSTTATILTTSITAILTVSDPQLNFNLSTLSGAWSMCYSALYSVTMYPNISTILSTCYKDKLLSGCRPVGNTLLTTYQKNYLVFLQVSKSK